MGSWSPQVAGMITSQSGGKVNKTLAFLDAQNPIYEQMHKSWLREEQRLYGGDPVLKELIRFDWEEEGGPHYVSRQQQASYINLPKIHATLITGHVSKKRPKPGSGLFFGSLGEVRTRENIAGTMTNAEILFYNTDGIGQDANEWAVWWDGVYHRAEATGHRWCMVEVPRWNQTLQTVLTRADELAGFRPYLVEYSPAQVTNWWYHNGELQFAVIRTQVDEPFIQNNGTLYMPQLAPQYRGYYLLVRQGCELLGPEYAGGGWWLWDSRRQFIDNGTWDLTGGRIPFFPVYAEIDPGTANYATMSRSQTMELGQCAVSIMNLMSSRDYDAWDAGMSRTYILGADPKVNEVVAEAMDSQLIPVPPLEHEDGSYTIPQIHDGSTGTVANGVFHQLIADKFDEAERLMLERASSDTDSSGAKQVASFAEGSSPLLVLRARNRQQAETTAIYFSELRWGTTQQPTGFAEYPDDYELAPLVDDIDAEFDTLRRAGAFSVSLFVDLIIQSLVERGIMPNGIDEDVLRAELTTSLLLKQQQMQNAAAGPQGLNGLTTPAQPGQPAPGANLPPLPPGPGSATPPTNGTGAGSGKNQQPKLPATAANTPPRGAGKAKPSRNRRTR